MELVLVRDGDVRSHEGGLVVVKTLPEGGELFVTISLGVVHVFKRFLCFDVKGSPAVIQMFQDLEGSDIAVHHEAMLQLGVVLFVKGVT